jgi:hypothetical protein
MMTMLHAEPFSPPPTDAAHIAYKILSHPAVILLDADTADRLEKIRDRRTRAASASEWAILKHCRDLLLRAERRDT